MRICKTMTIGAGGLWQHGIMKMKMCLVIFILATTFARAQTTNLTALLQQGLFEEQANRNLDAAIADYQTLAVQFDKDRQLAATAIFRLGECYREEGMTNEAALEYQRILRDFADQQTLATLSRQDLAGMGLAASVANTNLSPTQRLELVRQSESTGSDLSTDEGQEIQRIQTMIQNSPDLINALSNGNTPLGNAAAHGWLKVATFLLDHGADVNGGYGSALFNATRAGNRAMVELLLSRGANVNDNRQDTEKTTPLHIAASNGFQAVMQVLLANKADVNAQTRSGYTPLFEAAQSRQTKIVQMLLDAGASPNIADKEGRTPLSIAAESGSPEMVKALLAGKADPNAGTMDAPLLCAVDGNNPGCAELLLQADANPNVDVLMHCQQGSYGSRVYNEYSTVLRSATPLWLAIQQHELAMVQLLLKYKANPDLQTSEPPPVIFWALSDTNILQALLDAGANPNIKNNDGRTPLSEAAKNDSLAAIKLLLAAGANPNTNDKEGRTPLSFAADLGSAEMVKALLAAKADPNPDISYAPLVCAVYKDDPEKVQVLLQAGSDPNEDALGPAWGWDGGPILYRALSDTNILEALLNAGAKVDARDTTARTGDNRIWNWTPLLLAVANGLPVTTVEILLKHGANPNARDGAFGNTPLHWMGEWNSRRMPNREVLELLLDYKADPNVRNDAGQTPLDRLKQWAAGNNLSPEQRASLAQLADLLRQHGALDNLPHWDRITVSRPSAHYSAAMFYQGTNDWNHFTLFDLLGVQYDLLTASPSGAKRVQAVPYSYPANDNSFFPGGSSYSVDKNRLSFPDLTRIVIHRPSATGTNWNELKINLARALNSGDCSGDMPLRFGDVVEIPEADHVINESWTGLSTNELFTLKSCLTRHLQIIVNGQTTKIIAAPQVWELIPGSREYPLSSFGAKMPPAVGLLTAEPFMLWPVLDNSQLLLASSDLSRVVVKRRDAAIGKLNEWTVDCSNPGQPPNFWLRDGDVIEVPEKP